MQKHTIYIRAAEDIKGYISSLYSTSTFNERVDTHQTYSLTLFVNILMKCVLDNNKR